MKYKRQKKLDKLRIEFLPETLEIVERPMAPLGRIIIWMVFLLLLVFIIWACVGKMDEIATARGMVVSKNGTCPIQASANGVIKNIYIREGDTIHRGDLLYSMDADVERKNIEYAEGEVGLLQLKIDMIDDMLKGNSLESYKNGFYKASQKEVIDSMIAMNDTDLLLIEEYEIEVKKAERLKDNNKSIYDIEKQKYLAEQKTIQDKMAEFESVNEIELEVLQDNYEQAAQEVEKYQKLFEAGAKAKAELDKKIMEADSLESQIRIKEAEIREEKLSNEANASNINYQIQESQFEKNEHDNESVDNTNGYQQALNTLDGAKKQRKEKLLELKNQCVEEIKKYDIQLAEQYLQYESKDIIAQYDGIVKTVLVDKIGTVVTTAQEMADVVPASGEMLVEVSVNNSDIGFVKIGQQADIKIDTFDYQRYGKLEGVVTYISPDAVENEQHQNVYKVDVMLKKESEKNFVISQGMDCTVEIKTDQRRIISFFLEPLVDAFERGLKER